MARTLAGKRILLTGASSGIGSALTEQLARKGTKLAIVARDGDRLAEMARTLGTPTTEILPIRADLTNAGDRERIVREAVARFGGLDLLINNAGVASAGHFSTSDEAILRQIMEVNFFAPVDLIRLAIPHLTMGKEPAIVNVSSMCGRRAIPAWPEYSASKYALCGITEALRGEMARFEIDVLLIIPGLTQSDLRRNMLRDDARMRYDLNAGMTAAEVAGKIIRAIEKNRTETVLGSDARWMLRLHRFFPRILDRLISRRVRRLYETN
jgi:short-subunit dehydrogenase